MSESTFTVTQFENRNGTRSWRVSGFLNDIRIRKNFLSREEAAAEKGTLEIKAAQTAAGMRPLATSLTERQAREAEAAFQRLDGRPRSLTFYLDYALCQYREPQHVKKVADAIAEYVASKQHERDQDLLSIAQLDRIRRELKRFGTLFPNASMSEITGPRLVEFFEQGRASMKTFNNRRGIVSTLLKYAFLKGWIAENPLLRIPAHRIRRRRSAAKTLSAGQVKSMMEALESYDHGRWVPFVALALFAGIRPAVPNGEIARLKPEDIDLDASVIKISAEVSKVREPRKVVIHPNLAAWLRAYPPGRMPLVIADFQRQHAALTKRFGLSHDVLRHTFISMFVAKYRSLGEAALQAGNSESIIRRHYLDLKTTGEAEEFWSILPKRGAGSETPRATSPAAPEQTARLIEHRTAA